MTRTEAGYLLGSLALCAVLLGAHFSGRQIEQAAQRDVWDVLAAGRDVVGEQFGAAAPVDVLEASSYGASDSDAVAILPTWVQVVRAASLWPDPWSEEASGSFDQWQFLRVAGAEGSRFRVEAYGLEGGGVEGWIDIDDCGLSGPPPPWVRTTRSVMLYSHPLSSEGVQLAADADLMIVGEPIHDMLHVYWPPDIAPRRGISSGWIEANAVERSAAPRDLALPSPSFRAVPARRAGTYRVRPRDSLVSISATSGIAADELARRNGLDPHGPLLVGQILQVGTLPSAAQAQGPGPTQTREMAPGWISAEYAVVIDGDSGRILWAREPNTPVAPASLTKILTAALVLDYAKLSDSVTVRVDSRRMPSSTVMGLYPGETLTVEDLLYGMMLPSGNDAALALAHHVAGTQEAFAELMNEKMKSLGLTDSQFANPHGLDAPGQVSTAFDMAMLARSAMATPTFRDLAVARDYETPRGRGYEVYNLNQLLWRYPGADGVKIGYTPAAGRAIVASASREGRRVYVAMMRSNDIYADSATLLDWAFASHSWG